MIKVDNGIKKKLNPKHNTEKSSYKTWYLDIDLIGLYGKFNGDISIETNTLTNLSNENIVDTIKKNLTKTLYKSKNQRYNRIGKLIYQKVIYNSSNTIRTKDCWEGIYIIHVPTKNIRKYYTSFLYLTKFLISEKIHPRDVEVSKK